MNAALVALTIGLVRRLPGWAGPHKWAATGVFLALMPAIVLIGVHLVAPVTRLTAAVAVSALLLVEVSIPRRDARAAPVVVWERSWPDGVGVAALGAVVGYWAGATLFGGTHYVWDDLTYHAASPAWWLQTASLDVAPFTYQAYFPFNAELLSLWLMLPFSHDAHVNVGVFLWMALAAASAISIAISLGQDRASAMCWTALFLAAPTVRELAYSFAPTDLAVGSFALAAIAFALIGQEAEGRERATAAVMSGLAIGGAVGTKVIIVSTAGLLLFWWAYVALGKRRDSRWWLPVALFFGCAVFAGGWWYLRNFALVGNPLFPAEIGPIGGPFDKVAQRDTSMIPFLKEGWADLMFWRELVWLRWDWPLALGMVSLFGTVTAVVCPIGPRPVALRFLGIVVLAILCAFPLTPFSGTANRPGFGLHDYQRYLAFPFGLGLVLAGSVAPPRSEWRPWLVVAPAALLVYVWWDVTIAEMGTMCIGASISLIAWFAATDLQGAAIFRRRELPWALGAAVLVLLALHTPLQRARATSNLLSFGAIRISGELGARAAWRVLERLPKGSNVGYYAFLPHNNRFFYPQFGRDLQLNPRVLAEDGSRLMPLHERWELQRGGWWRQFDDKTSQDGDTFVANLLISEVDFVMVTQCQGNFPWPRQRRWLMRSTAARLIHGDWCSEVWDVREDGQPVDLEDLDVVGKEATDRQDRKRPKRKKRRKKKAR